MKRPVLGRQRRRSGAAVLLAALALNLVVIRDPALAKRYEANWEEHQLHAEGFAQ
ncbi:MAG: hypothetical protein HYY90_05825 [Candidatus Omnitrophica bacterium]|nr:hypothetical protein [Candidatus Omnitrophota bacterium]MBI3083864.1 hypothetical protein [Candidatus Omnitrophota bacterium]